MARSPSVRVERVRGQAAVVLSSGAGRSSGPLEAVFLPSMGMLGASLSFDGEEYLSLHGGVTTFAQGHTTGIPLLHPWANRLAATGYRAAGVDVSLVGAPDVHRDGAGLPIHGTMVGPRSWQVERVDAGRRSATLRASFDLGAHRDLLASFPFPHVIGVQVRVKGRTMTVTTTVRPTGKRAVPISFGWHPYFRLPGVRRAELALELPARHHLQLDARGLPTGASTREPAEDDPIAERTFDDAYRLSRRDRTLGLTGGGRGLTISFDVGYGYSQVYAPPGKQFVALEPMTAPTNRLATGSCFEVQPGDRHSATFTVRIARPARAATSAPAAPTVPTVPTGEST